MNLQELRAELDIHAKAPEYLLTTIPVKIANALIDVAEAAKYAYGHLNDAMYPNDVSPSIGEGASDPLGEAYSAIKVALSELEEAL